MIIDAPKTEHIQELRTLWKEAFGDSEAFLDEFFEKIFSVSHCRCVVENGRVVASLYLFDCEYKKRKIAYLYAIATLKEYRGRGLCSMLMRDTHSHLKALGYSLAILVPASKELFSFYERMGYKACTCVTEKTVYPTDEIIDLKRISRDEYARLRRIHLPEGSIIQEGKNLVFLDMTAELYEVNGVLIALQKDEDKKELRIIELLGDETKASAVINTLGYKKGIVRTVGNGREFSMCLELAEKDIEQPRYFGLAFD